MQTTDKHKLWNIIKVIINYKYYKKSEIDQRQKKAVDLNDNWIKTKNLWSRVL